MGIIPSTPQPSKKLRSNGPIDMTSSTSKTIDRIQMAAMEESDSTHGATNSNERTLAQNGAVNSAVSTSETIDPIQTAAKFVAGQEVPCHLTPGHFDGSKLLYTSTEHHLYKKNKYVKKQDICYWVCQDCKARVRTKGDPKNLQLFEPTVCCFTETYSGHINHSTKELTVKKLQKKQQLKDAVGAAEPSTSTKTSVAREQFNKLVSPEEWVNDYF